MILSDKDIVESIEKGEIVIEPFEMENLNPGSYDLRLGNTLTFYEKGIIIDTRKGSINNSYTIKIPKEGFALPAHTACLASTLEYTETYGRGRGIVPILEGKSSIGRSFLKAHITAGYGDDGFKGHWTLELETSNHPVRIYAGMKIAQVSYTLMTGKPMESYQDTGRYNNKEKNAITSKGV